MRNGIARLGALLIALLAVVPFSVSAQDGSRFNNYSRFDSTYSVEEDSTVAVTERLEYQFIGTYHQGYRNLSHAGSDAITDISVRDAETGEALTRSFSRLDKTDPESWGKYTTYEEDGATIIEWYYDVSDRKYTWELSYTLHGAVSFYDGHDELYWNVFTELDAPVVAVSALVRLPHPIENPRATWYVIDAHNERIEYPDNRSFLFTAANFGAHEPATIAAGWQKGLVSHKAYLADWLRINWPYVLSALIALGTILFCILYWYFTERHRSGRGVVIPQYEPPEGLPPAIAELIVNERVSRRTWPATIVDLAVRGYLSIEQEAPTYLEKLVPVSLRTKDYRLTRSKQLPQVPRGFEALFLDSLMPDGTFSTRDLRKSPSEQRRVYAKMKLLEKSLLEETDIGTGAYEHSLSKESQMVVGIVVLVSFSIFALQFLPSVPNVASYASLVLLFITTLICAGLITYMVRYEARLNKRGQVLREDWLGFKLYLATAEQYRLQDLPPDRFEKFLPYAMIFGVEKKWARSFEGITLPPPSWYHGAYVGGVASGSFSPTSFASGFSASFASSFASSGASGSSGGGGSAGGGGGGGGGGAS
ncbi:MAG: putative membrane protein [Parcubacteria bacterium C7867-004]|nr:MAG: putative membrane protein [Parcubacteria bacterium C7867-004]